MAASTIQNPPAQGESKTAKKKKSKTERTDSPAPAATATPEKASSVAGHDATQDDASENVYIRDIQKNIRNVTKKISNAGKTSQLVTEHSDKSLDQLVTLRIINADQKAQLLKKPELEAQLADLESQLSVHKKLQQELRARLAEQEKALTDKFEAEKAALVSELEEKSSTEASKTLHDSLLVLSQFLRLAAARRVEDTDAGADENLALEGVLLRVYSGDEDAVSTMLKLVHGIEEQALSTASEELQTTYAQVKQLAIAHSAPLFQTETSTAESEDNGGKDLVQTDPTVANAGLTEIDAGTTTALTNGHTQAPSSGGGLPANMDVGDSAANAAAAGDSPSETANDMTMSQEWVNVKVSEAEPSQEAVTFAPATSQSWADDQPDIPAEAPVATPADANDGFHQVQRNRGNREGAGWRGNRGGFRGRGGYRGDGRGRGRGSRGARSTPRRGGDES